MWVAYLLCISMVAGIAPAGAAVDTGGLLYPLPSDRTPNDGIANDDGWLLVDFCTAGATGNGPAAPPDCHHNDDDSAIQALSFAFTLYGDLFSDVYVNTNGNLSFGSLFSTFTSTGFPVDGFPMVAPFWGDVDTRGQSDSADASGHIWFKEFGDNTFVVTWDAVGYYQEHHDLKNTFQVAISDGTNPRMGIENNVCFSYGDMQWTTGDASFGLGGFGGVPATVGVNRGNGADFAQIGRFDHAGADYDGPSDLADGVSYLDGKQFCFDATGENIPPIAQGFPTAPVVIDVGTTFNLSVGFSSPESEQTTTTVIHDPDGAQSAGLDIINTSGNLATADMTWTPDVDDAGVYVLTFVASDSADPPGQTTQTLTIEVNAPVVNQPPVADADGPYAGLEGSMVTFDGSVSSDPDGDPLTFEWDFGDGNTALDAGPTPTHTYVDNGSYEVCVTISDGTAFDQDCTTADIVNAAPSVGAISVSTDLLEIQHTVETSADFTDPGISDTHTAIWDWGDGNTTVGTFPETNGEGTATGSHVYADPGVYTITLTVTDDDGDSGTAVHEFVVVYDPDGGFVTGGGWINSPAGAYSADETLDGKANFGFVSKYKKGASTPTGNTEFQFKAGDLNFHSSSYAWLVVTGSDYATFKGEGAINGDDGYRFVIWAGDDEPDTFRIKIWIETDGDETVVYDNGFDQVIEGGSIVIHDK